MKINKLSTVFLCCALCASLITGCGERRSTSLSERSDEDTASSVLIEASAVSDTSSDEPDTSSFASETSAESAVSSDAEAESSTVPTPVQSSSSTQSDPQPTEESSEPEHQHLYSLVKTVKPTCSEVGYEIYTCSCGDEYTEVTAEALGHSYSKTTVSPTCTDSGYTTYTCTRCGQSHKDDNTAALGHKYTSKTVKATCTQKGYTVNTCSRCGHEYTSDSTAALGHSWGGWTVTKNATTSSEGVKKAECPRCGDTKTESIPKLKAESGYISEVVRLVNVERAKYGLSPLTMRADLNEYAQLRSTEIVYNFDHVRPDGASPLKYVLGLSGTRTAGENIAYGYRTPEAVMNGWMNSEGHRANILKANYTSIGVGCYEYNGTLYWTQIFAG